MPKNRMAAIPLGTFNAANLTANFQPIYPGGLPHAVAALRINNLSNVDIYLSFDGITTNDIIPAGTPYIIPVASLAQPNNYVMQVSKGSMLSIKWVAAAGIGSIYTSGYYNAE